MVNIPYADARAMAEKAALRNLSYFIEGDKAEVLDVEFVEAEHCWMFFRSKEINIPEEGMLKAGWAYAVSKDGEIREVPDYSDDQVKLNEYLEKMSDFFGRLKK